MMIFFKFWQKMMIFQILAKIDEFSNFGKNDDFSNIGQNWWFFLSYHDYEKDISKSTILKFLLYIIVGYCWIHCWIHCWILIFNIVFNNEFDNGYSNVTCVKMFQKCWFHQIIALFLEFFSSFVEFIIDL